jgi:hypothetical protein
LYLQTPDLNWRWFAAIRGGLSSSTDQLRSALVRRWLMRGVLVFPAVLLGMVALVVMF